MVYLSDEAPDCGAELMKLEGEIAKLSEELAEMIASFDGDILAARSSPQVLEARDRLCRLHRKAMVICVYDPIDHESTIKMCEALTRPRACVQLLQLSEERVCCTRF